MKLILSTVLLMSMPAWASPLPPGTKPTPPKRGSNYTSTPASPSVKKNGYKFAIPKSIEEIIPFVRMIYGGDEIERIRKEETAWYLFLYLDGAIEEFLQRDDQIMNGDGYTSDMDRAIRQQRLHIGQQKTLRAWSRTLKIQ